MVQVGHALLGTAGEVLSLDAGFCAILQTEAEAIIGRSVLDVTVPGDRNACAMLMRNLRMTREPFRVDKRYIRADGSSVWVSNTVSIIELGDSPPMLVSTIVPIAEPGSSSPATLLDCARFLIVSRRERAAAFQSSVVVEPAWDIMLTAYVAEAEGGSIDVETIAESLSMPAASVRRWMRGLAQEGLLEPEKHSGRIDGDHYRLTDRAHENFETYLSGLMRGSQAIAERA